jgi:hypothetical protein
MQPDAKGLWLMDFATVFPSTIAGEALPLAYALVEELFDILRRLGRADPALARPLRKAAIALPHALVQARLATRKSHAARHLARARTLAREVHRLLVIAEACRHFAPGPRIAAITIARRLLDCFPLAG